MNKLLISVLIIVAVLVGGFFIINSYIYEEKQADITQDYKDVGYMIEGNIIFLGEEFKYFGNKLVADLDSDGRDDIVFLITHQPGGSGTFYYAVVALNTENGYVGSEGYFLGDRIAPQTTGLSQNPRHKNVVVVNYAERNPGEPMTTQPSAGKSAYIKLDIENMQWGIVEPDFEGEAENLPPAGE